MGILDTLKISLGVVVGVAVASVYYNGVPILKELPVIGFLFEGQAKKGLVPEFQVAALNAQIAERDRQIKANEYVITSYQAQLSNARAAEQARSEQSEQEIAAYGKRLADEGRACRLDRADIDWLRKS
ncbi:hypothetical protein WKW50_12135 [Ochrobactrum sp. GPK 3]